MKKPRQILQQQETARWNTEWCLEHDNCSSTHPNTLMMQLSVGGLLHPPRRFRLLSSSLLVHLLNPFENQNKGLLNVGACYPEERSWVVVARIPMEAQVQLVVGIPEARV